MTTVEVLDAVEVLDVAAPHPPADGPAPPPCDCAAPGWCPRHRRSKPHALWSNCRNKPYYRRHWDEMAAALEPDQVITYNPADEPHEGEERTWRRVGVGDLVAFATGLFGFKPCAKPCAERRVALNRFQLPAPAAVAEAAPPPTTWVDVDLPPRFGLTDQAVAVGMTTAPREVATCAATLRSLALAGFTDVRVFAEPGSVIPRAHGAAENDRTRGVLQNWLYALRALRLTRPDAIVYGVVQDDLIFPRGLRGWLERELLAWPAWREGRVGFLSTYRSEGKSVDAAPNGRRRRPVKEWRPSERYLDLREPATPGADGRAIIRERAKPGGALWGACTYWLSPRAADVLLADAGLARHTRMIDLRVHPVLAAAGLEAWYTNPSLTEHRAGPSSIGHGQGRGMSSGGNFVGEEYELCK